MDAKKTAQQVLEQVGGAENVTFLTHCVTRLRFNLKSMDGVDEAKVKAVPGVVGVVNKGGQYQVIIGNEVAAVYDELVRKSNSLPPRPRKRRAGSASFWTRWPVCSPR